MTAREEVPSMLLLASCSARHPWFFRCFQKMVEFPKIGAPPKGMQSNSWGIPTGSFSALAAFLTHISFSRLSWAFFRFSWTLDVSPFVLPSFRFSETSTSTEKEWKNYRRKCQRGISLKLSKKKFLATAVITRLFSEHLFSEHLRGEWRFWIAIRNCHRQLVSPTGLRPHQ